MPRVVLIHWKPAEAEERLARLARAGYTAELLVPESAASLKALRERVPDAFVIDLTRLPSQGRAVGVDLRSRQSTRRVPIVFAGGEPEKVAAVRSLLPDAGFADWDNIAEALRRAREAPPQEPVSPGTMAGYSGTPLVKKLGIKAGATVALIGAPEGFERTLGDLPEEVSLVRSARRADLVLLFAGSRAELEQRFAGASRMTGQLWVLWPKRTSGVRTDVGETFVRKFCMNLGWVDYKICAVDATWSGLKFTLARR